MLQAPIRFPLELSYMGESHTPVGSILSHFISMVLTVSLQEAMKIDLTLDVYEAFVLLNIETPPFCRQIAHFTNRTETKSNTFS